MKQLIYTLFTLLVFVFACKDENPSLKPNIKELSLPELTNNQSVSAMTIGRVLFYDTRLSVNNFVACASCHKQTHGFADDKAFSTGFQNGHTVRNSIAINNLSTFQDLFWDGRENQLQTMVLRPLTNHVEMGMSDLSAIAERVKSAGYYQELFKLYYHDDVIDIDRISSCLSSFVNSIRASNSKFDMVNMGSASFTALEQQGRELFFNVYPCGSCHSLSSGGYNTQPVKFSNIGLDVTSTDPGRFGVTHEQSDEGKFKIPSLKNIALTGPYMHDGRFVNLSDVLNHYSSGIMNHQNLDSKLKNSSGEPLKLDITASQKEALIAFLSTLTDNSMLSNPYYSDPFTH